jgi:hypothetical protein
VDYKVLKYSVIAQSAALQTRRHSLVVASAGARLSWKAVWNWKGLNSREQSRSSAGYNNLLNITLTATVEFAHLEINTYLRCSSDCRHVSSPILLQPGCSGVYLDAELASFTCPRAAKP